MSQMLYKNFASQKLVVYAVNAVNGLGVSGIAGTITAQISKDSGAFVNTNDVNPTEISGSSPGFYAFDLTQAETNADTVILSSASTTPNVVFDPIISSTSSSLPDVNVLQINGSATASSNASAFFSNAGFAATNSSIGTISNTGIEGYTLNQAMKLILSFVGGTAAGATATSGVITFKSAGGSSDRLVMTVDANGNRTAVTLTP
jgi:hypothetical protein